jgi:hypothetical protein
MASVSVRVLRDVDNIHITGKRTTQAPMRARTVARTMVNLSWKFLLLKKVVRPRTGTAFSVTTVIV